LIGAARALAIAAVFTSACAIATAVAGSELPPLARAAAADLVQLDAARLEPEGSAARTLHILLDRGTAAVRSERLRANRDADAALETSFDDNAALLLRLRVLEAIAFHLEADAAALGFASAGDSLAAAVYAELVNFPRGEAAILALAAGLAPQRAQAGERLAEMRRTWAEWAASGGGDADRLVLLAHVVAAASAGALEPAHERGLDPARAAAVRAVAARRLPCFRAEDPARRLLLAVRLLRRDGAVPPSALAQCLFLAQAPAPDAAQSLRRAACADSVRAVLEASDTRPTPIHGSRRDYYRKQGEAAPILDATADSHARTVARAALLALRAADGDAALAALGITVHSEPDPFEVVPEQALATVWSLTATTHRSFSVRTAHLGDARVGVTPAAATIPGGGSVQLRTAYASIAGRVAGDVLVTGVELHLDIAEFGPVTVVDRIVAHVVAPVQATLVPVDGPVVRGDDKVVDVVVTSRAPYAFTGGLTVLATHDWTIAPAAAYRFSLRRPGQSARQRLVLSLPRSAAPGYYELALRIDADDTAVGTLRTRLVKPMRWAVVGPFAPTGANARLAPENGVSLEARYQGMGGTQIAWQAVPDDAYDGDGALDLDAVLARPGRNACACAFTVLESAEAGTARIDAVGAQRVRWNGVAPAAGGMVRVERGRNLLLVRTCSSADADWRLRVALVDDRGAPLHILANDLVRLLNGYAALITAAPHKRGGPVDRVVTLRFAGAATDVDVLGSFNSWVPLDLQRQPDGTWQRDLRLSPGRYAYKLLVDGKLRSDPEAPAFEADGFGGRNSLLIVR